MGYIKENWITLKKYKVYKDGEEPPYPLSFMTTCEMQKYFEKLYKNNPDCDDFMFTLEWKYFKYGAINYWYELKGRKKCFKDTC